MVDTNILLYAADTSSEFHGPSRELLERSCSERSPWFLTWSICHEFLRVSTHPRDFARFGFLHVVDPLRP